MTTKRRVEQLINGAFRPLKLQLRQGSNHDMYDALKTCQTLGLEVNSFIDVGASDGKWTEDAAMVYRNAHFLMIEMRIPLQDDSEVIFDFIFVGPVILVTVGDYGMLAGEMVLAE